MNQICLSFLPLPLAILYPNAARLAIVAWNTLSGFRQVLGLFDYPASAPTIRNNSGEALDFMAADHLQGGDEILAHIAITQS